MQKIKILIFTVILLKSLTLTAQDVYIIEGDTLQLQREVKGPLSLFWMKTGNDYRFFIQKKKHLSELVRDNAVYKKQLREMTADAAIRTDDVKFLLYSLKHFVNSYNVLVQEDYQVNTSTSNLQYRLGLFTGLSNNRYTDNPNNIIAPILGLELEIHDPNLAPRHSAFLQLRQSFESEEYRYSSTRLSVNYRFRVIQVDQVGFHIDTELVTLFHSEDRVNILNDQGTIIAIREERGFSFTAPLSFGLGADIQVTEVSYISLSYNDVVSLVLDGNDFFPIDFSVGYKFSL